RDTVLPDVPPLFTYSDTGRIQLQVLNGLRVSGGAPRTAQTTKSAFPKDPYSTTITPYRQDVSRSFGIESSLPAIAVPSEYVRAALPMDCWIMFTPTNSFNKVGKLVIRRLNSGEFPDKSFNHWAMATPDNNPGDFIAYDIIAYGNTLIPEEV
ncbi:hypothetical protein PISMIDRAFT_70959, partial [Pisolithus microcarpus 441]